MMTTSATAATTAISIPDAVAGASSSTHWTPNGENRLSVHIIENDEAVTAGEDGDEGVNTIVSMTVRRTYHVTVLGMMCQRNCGATVTNALLSIPQVCAADASFAQHRAWAQFSMMENNDHNNEDEEYDHNDGTSLSKAQDDSEEQRRRIDCEQRMIAAIESVGFEARPIPLDGSPSISSVSKQSTQSLFHGQNSQSVREEEPSSSSSSFNGAAAATVVAQQYHYPKQQHQQQLQHLQFCLTVTGMSCSVCTRHVQAALQAVPGVQHVQVVLTLHRAYIQVADHHMDNDNYHDSSSLLQSVQTACIRAVQNAGYEAFATRIPAQPQHLHHLNSSTSNTTATHNQNIDLHEQAMELERVRLYELHAWRRLYLLSLVLTLPLLFMDRTHGIGILIQSMLFPTATTATTTSTSSTNANPSLSSSSSLLIPTLSALLSTIVQVCVGRRFYRAAWKTFPTLGMDALIVLGTTASFAYSLLAYLGTIVDVLLLSDPTHISSHNNHNHMTSMTMMTNMAPTFVTSAMLLHFVALGKFLECYAQGKTSRALQTLLELQPQHAHKVVRTMTPSSAVSSSCNSHDDDDENDTNENNKCNRSSSTFCQSQGPEQILQILQNNGCATGIEVEPVPVQDLNVGDIVQVLPGMRIPSDGQIIHVQGKVVSSSSPSSSSSKIMAYVDESAFTGEPFPVAKSVGDSVLSSSINQLSPILVRVTAVGNATCLAQICHLVQQAQRQTAPIQRKADHIASIFTPTIILLSLCTAIFWWFFQVNLDHQMDDMIAYSHDHNSSWVNKCVICLTSTITVLVVACPCALGLATPTAVMVGTGVGATQGLLIKGGAVLETLHNTTIAVLDKTGTLTTGKAVVATTLSYLTHDMLARIPHPPSLLRLQRQQQQYCTASKTDLVLLWLAACAESSSEHPLAAAVCNAAKSSWGNVTLGARLYDHQVVPGRGVECTVQYGDSNSNDDAVVVRVGSREWTKAKLDNQSEASQLVDPCPDCAGDEDVAGLRRKGQIGVYVSILFPSSTKRIVVGVIGIIDPISKQAKSTVAALRRMGMEVYMCTGDHELTALAVAQEIGIDDYNVCSSVTPQGKASLVSSLQEAAFGRERNRVLFCGDGINDSIALARADVGIAVGAGTQVAVEAADVVLIKSSLHDIVVAIHLSQVVFRRIVLNFAWAMCYNIFALPFAAGFLFPLTDFRLPPEYAGLMMAFSSVSVVTSSLLLRNYRRPRILENGELEGGSGLPSIIASFLSSHQCFLPVLFRQETGYSKLSNRQAHIEMI